MKNQTAKPLTIYKASAGSGKTFTLATEYIKLVIKNPQCYRSILAVTFTNKATEEMKMRILSQLYGIWKRLADSRKYMYKVTNELGISEETASLKAGIALSNLIHNYNYFRVETIDSFFQSVLRNLARELDLTANLRIELNDRQIEQQAVDALIENLEPTSKILGWIMSYVRANISDDKGWNVISQIKSFGENIFNDYYKTNSELLNSVLSKQNFFESYTKQLRKIMSDSKAKISQYADKFFETLDYNGLSVDDFPYGKSGVCGYFIKLKNGIYAEEYLLGSRVLDAMNDPMKWLKKSDQKSGSMIMGVVESTLFHLLKDVEAMRPKQVRLYRSADITLRNLNQLRLLSYIEKKVREMNEGANRFLLSDTQTLLHSLIEESDSPFIFEKIGTQLEHVMIDEFQDTSTVQWNNFKVLLNECMSHEYTENLIVGDVKQSIYRWRSGDWRLLNNIKNEFNSSKARLNIESLDTNYRSDRKIIEFNNAFFKAAADAEYEDQRKKNPEEAEQLKYAYKDVKQQIPADKTDSGYVHIELLPNEDYQQVMMERLTDTVCKLIDSNVPANKIAILVRYNKTIQQIADHFMQVMPTLKLVSDEAFRLDASMAVNILVNALHFLMHPDDAVATANLVKAYQKRIEGNTKRDNELFIREKDITKLLPKEFVDGREDLLTMPLFDLTERLYRIFKLNRLSDESAYVCAFFDKLKIYLADNVTDIDSFVGQWNDNLHNKTIQSDEIDGIRLITIHKSKGLEFDNVIMPFCDWQLEKSGANIWCTPTEYPFRELPIVPINFNAKDMKETIYEKDYLHEHLQNSVDNLNLLYVAFTRASKNLFVYGKRESKNKANNSKKYASNRSSVIENNIEAIAAELGGSTYNRTDDENDSDILMFEYGTLSISDNNSNKEATHNVFNLPIATENLKIETFKNKVGFRQSNKSHDFIEDYEDEKSNKSYINVGNILHKLFSTIRTTADIESALAQLENDGILYDDILSRDKLQTMLRKRLEDPHVALWFDPKWQLFNECSILHIDPTTNEVTEHRPDRVMMDGNEVIVVDFKFGRPRKEYHNQVSHYIQLLASMGYQNIKGYLWFVYSNKIEKVK